MDIRLHFLESFNAKGSDGATYKVKGYERMAAEAPSTHGYQGWESTGVAEYHLEDGRLVDMANDGTMRIVGSNVQLVRPTEGAAAARAKGPDARK